LKHKVNVLSFVFFSHPLFRPLYTEYFSIIVFFLFYLLRGTGKHPTGARMHLGRKSSNKKAVRDANRGLGRFIGIGVWGSYRRSGGDTKSFTGLNMRLIKRKLILRKLNFKIFRPRTPVGILRLVCIFVRRWGGGSAPSQRFPWIFGPPQADKNTECNVPSKKELKFSSQKKIHTLSGWTGRIFFGAADSRCQRKNL
jgi:hypothetical protein